MTYLLTIPQFIALALFHTFVGFFKITRLLWTFLYRLFFKKIAHLIDEPLNPVPPQGPLHTLFKSPPVYQINKPLIHTLCMVCSHLLTLVVIMLLLALGFEFIATLTPFAFYLYASLITVYTGLIKLL